MGLRSAPGGERSTVLSQVSPNWVTTRLDFLVNWGRSNSLWPMPFGTACCAIEFMATAAARFDLARFGMERMSFTPRQAVPNGMGHRLLERPSCPRFLPTG